VERPMRTRNTVIALNYNYIVTFVVVYMRQDGISGRTIMISVSASTGALETVNRNSRTWKRSSKALASTVTSLQRQTA